MRMALPLALVAVTTGIATVMRLESCFGRGLEVSCRARCSRPSSSFVQLAPTAGHL
jgi:hypothetical protein